MHMYRLGKKSIIRRSIVGLFWLKWSLSLKQFGENLEMFFARVCLHGRKTDGGIKGRICMRGQIQSDFSSCFEDHKAWRWKPLVRSRAPSSKVVTVLDFANNWPFSAQESSNRLSQTKEADLLHKSESNPWEERPRLRILLFTVS